MYFGTNKFSSITIRNNGDINNDFKPNLSLVARLSFIDVQNDIKNTNRDIGFDAIYSNHLKFAGKFTVIFLTKFLTSCLIPNHFSTSMLTGADTNGTMIDAIGINPITTQGERFCYDEKTIIV